MEVRKGTSPKLIARITGLSYLLTLLCGIFSMGYITNSLLVEGDAAASAINILENQSMFQLSYSVYLMEMIFQLVSVVLLYLLLKPAGKNLAITALGIGVVGCALKAVSQLFYIAALEVLSSAEYMKVFTKDQIQAFALLFLDLNRQNAAIAMVFLGLFSVLAGYLIIKSTYLPKALGYITALGGAGWLFYLYPPFGYSLFPFIALAGLIGVISIIFWLIWFGVDEDRWLEKALSRKTA